MITEQKEEHAPLDLPKIIALLLRMFPSLMIRLFGVFLRFKRDAKKGGHIYYNELLNQGLHSDVAQRLTDVYLEGSNIRRLFQQMLSMNPFFK